MPKNPRTSARDEPSVQKIEAKVVNSIYQALSQRRQATVGDSFVLNIRNPQKYARVIANDSEAMELVNRALVECGIDPLTIKVEPVPVDGLLRMDKLKVTIPASTDFKEFRLQYIKSWRARHPAEKSSSPEGISR